MGTTGASMLLIRPVIRSNAPRKYKIHIIIFFIFLVANIGGALTPLGDPPLFLGFLHGVPFFWTMQLIPIMGLVSILLLIIFFLLDSVLYHREKLPPSTEKIPLKLEGYHNFLFLLGIIGAVLMSGKWQAGEIDVWGVKVAIQDLTRDGIILLMGILSVLFTKNITRQDNHFTWGPIKEVAYLFAGIFVTILPVLDMLRAGSSGALAFIVNAVKEPFHYYWAAGGLSSFLDNAPTYLTYFNLALGRLGLPESMITPILTGAPIDPAYQAQAATFVFYLKAISAGAVFFGANTYIGNAPNFMVRSIALENDIKMPSFFGYMLWSIGILIPLFILTTFIFFI
jgi:Na+/H+ antiporter NhaD/arsenite permease-like protein